MKLKTAIAVLVVGICPAVVWAGADKDSSQQPQASDQHNSSAGGASAESAQSNGKTTGWQYVDGRAASAERGVQNTQQPQGSSDSANAANAGQATNAESAESAESNSSNDQDEHQSAAVESGSEQQMGGDQSTQLQGIPEGMEDKLVVILPTNWQGSLRDLLAALEQTSQASEILVLRREGQDDDMSSEDSSDVEDTSDTSSR
ncbi:MAG TPA: hypothetical protein VN496_06535 [Burkholderiales bacterium]|nr:hypothetical protein [Burkholderiales bacterium]